MARLARRSPECRRALRLLAPAGAPLRIDELAAASAAFERSADRPAPRSSGAPRRGGGILEADLAGRPGRGDRARVRRARSARATARRSGDLAARRRPALTDTRGAAGRCHDRVPPRAHRRGPWRPTFCRPSGAAITRRSPAGLGARRVPGHAHHMARATSPVRPGSAAIEAAAAGRGDGRAGRRARPPGARPRARRPDGPAGSAGRPAATGRPARAGPRRRRLRVRGRPIRAAAFAESAIARLDERRRPGRPLALLHERLGRYRRAAGDPEGAIVAHRRAVELIPRRADP